MQVQMKYASPSRLVSVSGGMRLLQLAPNMARDRVSFDGSLQDPLAFREAVSALHEVVINDLRFQPRDKTAYQQWALAQRSRERAIRAASAQQKHQDIRAGNVARPPAELKRAHALALKTYWQARSTLNAKLRRENEALWRRLMPYDPVITVAEDVVFFECFSADQSSYGCLTVNRGEGFGENSTSGANTLGTTNVDYSWDLYDSFQSLRSYRQTRFQMDPDAFTVTTDAGGDEHSEEKIDLPDGWLRGFVQLQSAMALPARRVSLSVGAVYSLLAFLKRHKAKTSPRAMRFELLDGQSPRIVLEPWEQIIDSHATKVCGPATEPIRVWGRRRLLTLARVLPLATGVDVYLLGTGLPSFWVVQMGSMRLTLGLSGWTTNDWSSGSAVQMLMPSQKPSATLVASLAEALSNRRAATLQQLTQQTRSTPAVTAAGLNELALRGQAIYDLHGGVYRWRQMLPMALSDKEIGPPHPEIQGAAALIQQGQVAIESSQEGPRGGLIVVGKVEYKPCETLIDADGMVRRGKCVCPWHHRYGIRNGPCRHIQALRELAWQRGGKIASGEDWYDRLRVAGLNVPD